MFETIIKGVGNIIRFTFIPVVHAAPNEIESIRNEKIFDRLKMALTPGYEVISK